MVQWQDTSNSFHILPVLLQLCVVGWQMDYNTTRLLLNLTTNLFLYCYSLSIRPLYTISKFCCINFFIDKLCILYIQKFTQTLILNLMINLLLVQVLPVLSCENTLYEQCLDSITVILNKHSVKQSKL